MFLSMNWISDFVDLSGLNKIDLIHQFSLSTAEVENEIFFKMQVPIISDYEKLSCMTSMEGGCANEYNTTEKSNV